MYILGYAGAYDSHRWLTFFPFDLSFAYGPLLWLYIRVLTTGARPRRWLWHLFPAAVQALYFLIGFSLPLEQKWDWYTGPHLHAIAPLGAAFALVSASVYLLRSMREVAAYRAWLDSSYAHRDEARLTGLQWILAAFGIALLTACAFAFVSWFVQTLDYGARFPLMVVFALLTYSLGMLGWRNLFVAYPTPPPVSTATAVPIADTVDTGFVRREQAHRLKDQVLASEWWREADLDLPTLAQRLAVSERTLSRLLSEGLGMTFREFLGRLRTDAVATGGDARALLDIGLWAGFQSKASFNRLFLAHRGMTPSAYRRQIQERQGLNTRQITNPASVEATKP